MSDKVILCGGDGLNLLDPPVPPKVTTCADHTPDPSGYSDWHQWARTLAKTHKQERCGECGRFSIWRVRALGQEAENPIRVTQITKEQYDDAVAITNMTVKNTVVPDQEAPR